MFQININDKKLYDMSQELTGMLNRLRNTSRTALTYNEFVEMTEKIMKKQNPQDIKECQGIFPYEQQLPTNTGETYETGHINKDNHDGSDKLLKMEVSI